MIGQEEGTSYQVNGQGKSYGEQDGYNYMRTTSISPLTYACEIGNQWS